MSRDRANLLCYLMIVATVATAAWLYPELPDPMPSHWNVDGEVDGWIPKPWGVAVLPGAAILAFILFRLIPRLSPQGFPTAASRNVLNVLQVAFVAFACYVSFLVLFAARGVDVHMNQMIFGGIGLLFIVIGSTLGRVPQNAFVGVRTRWTLANDEVWVRTHRMAGRVFMLMGLLFIAGAFVRIGAGWLIGMIVLLALVPVAWSYFLYRRATRPTTRQ